MNLHRIASKVRSKKIDVESRTKLLESATLPHNVNKA